MPFSATDGFFRGFWSVFPWDYSLRDSDGDLCRMFIDEEQGDISSNLDERAGKWPEEIVMPLVQIIRNCCGPFFKRKKLAEICTTLQALVDCHCQPFTEEK